MKIPKQLLNPKFRFVLLKKGAKTPFERGWQTKGYRYDDEKFLKYINDGNYGVIGGCGDLRILDIDDEKLAKEFSMKIKTFSVRTGGGGMHFYFLSDYDKNHVLINELGELRSKNYQVVCPPSIHPNGKQYKVENDLPILEIAAKELKKLIQKYLREEIVINSATQRDTKKDTSRSGFEFGKVIQLLKKGKTKEEIFREMDKYSKWFNSPDQYKALTFIKAEKKFLEEKTDKKKPEKNIDTEQVGIMLGGVEAERIFFNSLTRLGQVEEFWKKQPFFYDRSKTFWLWDTLRTRWRRSDEVDFLNSIQKLFGAETINSKIKKEFVEAFRQVGRRHTPKDIKPTWVQFQSKLYDIETNEEFDATPEYFVTNPISWKLGKSENTPNIDYLFNSWVRPEQVQELYEIIAFCIVPSYFIHRIICLIGPGSNGKGTFLQILKFFLDKDTTIAEPSQNVGSSSLHFLVSGRFEGSKLYKKLACLIGETNFNIMTNTDFIKRATGQDLIRCEFKGKDSFDFVNYAKFIIATNSLPPTTDKTIGFYRRWKIIDFLNRFPKEKDMLSAIPNEEYENLALKCFNLAKKLWKRRVFTNDVNFEGRKQKFEETANPLITFIQLNYNQDVNGEIFFQDFFRNFNEFLDTHGKRTLTGKAVSMQLKNEGYEIMRLTKNDKNGNFILGLQRKMNEMNDMNVNPNRLP